MANKMRAEVKHDFEAITRMADWMEDRVIEMDDERIRVESLLARLDKSLREVDVAREKLQESHRKLRKRAADQGAE